MKLAKVEMEILRVKRGGCTTTTRDKTLVANFREEKTKQNKKTFAYTCKFL